MKKNPLADMVRGELLGAGTLVVRDEEGKLTSIDEFIRPFLWRKVKITIEEVR